MADKCLLRIEDLLKKSSIRSTQKNEILDAIKLAQQEMKVSKISEIVAGAKKYVDEVVVCDDGSTDSTADAAENSGAYVIKHHTNEGKGSAMKSLFKYALRSQADVIVTIDGDGQFLPKEMEKLCKPIISGVSDVVIGYRFDDNDKEIPSYRKIGNKFLDQLSNVSSNVSLRDTQSGFRSYSKDAIKKITFSTNGFGADAEILIDAAKKGLRISEEKVTVLYNVGSKTSTKNPIVLGTEIAASIIRQILIRNPFRYLGLPGIVFIILGAISCTYLITIFNETQYFSIPFTLLSSSFLIFGTMLLLFSGVLYSVNRAKKS